MWICRLYSLHVVQQIRNESNTNYVEFGLNGRGETHRRQVATQPKPLLENSWRLTQADATCCHSDDACSSGVNVDTARDTDTLLAGGC